MFWVFNISKYLGAIINIINVPTYIFTNIYMSSIIKYLTSKGHRCLVYADDIVLYLDFDTASPNNILISLHNILSYLFNSITPEKCDFIIFRY